MHLALLIYTALLNYAQSATLEFCAPPPGSAADFAFALVRDDVGLTPEGAALPAEPYAVLLLVSPDGGTLWDKSCVSGSWKIRRCAPAPHPPPAAPPQGYPFHATCEPPFALLGDAQGLSHGFPVSPDGAGVVRAWATAPEDAAAGWMQLIAVPTARLEADPYALFLDGATLDSVQAAVDACPACVFSVVVDRSLPCPAEIPPVPPPPPPPPPPSASPASTPPSLAPSPPSPPAAVATGDPPAEATATLPAGAGGVKEASGTAGAAPAALALLASLLAAAIVVREEGVFPG